MTTSPLFPTFFPKSARAADFDAPFAREEIREDRIQIVTEIRLRKGEPVERALRRLKKRIDREGTLREARNHRHFEKPSEKKRRKMKIAKFSAMLSARYADL